MGVNRAEYVAEFLDIGAVVIFKEDKRLGPDFLSINEFVGTMRRVYNPVTRKWKVSP